jgi:hypothetical protein
MGKCKGVKGGEVGVGGGGSCLHGAAAPMGTSFVEVDADMPFISSYITHPHRSYSTFARCAAPSSGGPV